jgi:hypothetical protein
MKKEPKVINVTCKGSRGVPRQELETFQGNLVELRQENFDKLRRLIIAKGFRFPVFVWNNKIIDGHQRLFVLKHLVESEGYLFPYDVPVCDIEAKDEKEAKELVLIARSEYGDTTDEGLFDFLEVNKLSFNDLKVNLELPGIEFDDFEKHYFNDNPGDAAGPVEQGPELDFTEELMESHNYLILYFDNEIDWQAAQEKFKIKTVKTRDSTDTYLLKGKGRVIRGVDIMERLND